MKKKANYGIDAPPFIVKFGLSGLLGLIISILLCVYLPNHWWCFAIAGLSFAATFFCLWPAVTIVLGSLKFKFRERDWLFEVLNLNGSETVLDVGCGHGLLSIGAAKRLTSGRVVGIDLWVQDDQASNSREATLENARIEGVDEKIEIRTGDMRQMEFADESFDSVISSWAIHNVYDPTEREKALSETVRVLKSQGKIAILDIDHAPQYAEFFKANGLKTEMFGPRYTFGNRTYLVLASKG